MPLSIESSDDDSPRPGRATTSVPGPAFRFGRARSSRSLGRRPVSEQVQGRQHRFLRESGGWIAVGLVALALGLALPGALRVALYARGAVPLVALALAVALWLSLPMLRAALQRAWQSGPASLLAPLVIVALLATYASQLPPRLRVIADDYRTAGLALGVRETGRAQAPARGLWLRSGELADATWGPDKRGALTPVLVGGANAVGEYRPARAYAAVLVLTGLALAAFYVALRGWLSRPASLAGVVLLASYPVVAWVSRSISLEPANLACLAGISACLARAVRDDDPDAAVLAAWLGVLAGHARHESVLLGALIVPVAAWVLAGKPGPRARVLLGGAILSYAPFLWHQAQPFDFELDPQHGPAPFTLSFLFDNLGHAARLLTLPDSANPLGPVIPLLASVGVLLLVRERRPDPGRRVAAIVALAPTVIASLVVFSYAWGDIRNPLTHRYGLPLMAALAALAALGLDRVVAARARLAYLAPAAAVLLFALVSTPVARLDEAYEKLPASKALFEARRWMLTQAPACRPVWATPYSTYFLVHGDGALAYTDLAGGWGRVREAIAAGDADLVVGLQVASLPEGTLLAKNALPAGFAVHALVELQVSENAAVRLVELWPESESRSAPARCLAAAPNGSR